MKVLTVSILLVLAVATLAMAMFETARAVLIWPCAPGVIAGLFFSGHGNHPIAGWVVVYVVNAIVYVGVALLLRRRKGAYLR